MTHTVAPLVPGPANAQHPATSSTAAVGSELVRLRRTLEAIRGRVLERGAHGVEGSALAALSHLVKDGDQRASTLAERLGLDPSTMSRHVAALVRSGHVERVSDPEDGRAALLRATDAGRQAFAGTQRLRTRLLDVALASWDPAEVDALARGLGHFNDTFAELHLDAVLADPWVREDTP